jgi:hypothetical protein
MVLPILIHPAFILSIQPTTWRIRFFNLCPLITGWNSYNLQAPGSLSFTSFNSQGYGGGILTRLHQGMSQKYYTEVFIRELRERERTLVQARLLSVAGKV